MDDKRKCSSCGLPFPPTSEFFSGDAKAKDGLKTICKICECDNSSIWYYNNQTEILERRYQQYYENHDEKKAYYRLYRKQKREERRAALAATA